MMVTSDTIGKNFENLPDEKKERVDSALLVELFPYLQAAIEKGVQGDDMLAVSRQRDQAAIAIMQPKLDNPHHRCSKACLMDEVRKVCKAIDALPQGSPIKVQALKLMDELDHLPKYLPKKHVNWVGTVAVKPAANDHSFNER